MKYLSMINNYMQYNVCYNMHEDDYYGKCIMP